jgi:hypothetical protein
VIFAGFAAIRRKTPPHAAVRGRKFEVVVGQLQQPTVVMLATPIIRSLPPP